jgi:hypothetical protein
LVGEVAPGLGRWRLGWGGGAWFCWVAVVLVGARSEYWRSAVWAGVRVSSHRADEDISVRQSPVRL